MRVAFIHDWLTGMRGGERVLEHLIRLFPDSEVFTLLHRRGSVSETIESRTIHTSFVDRLPFAHSAYRYYLPLFPSAVEAFDVRDFDLVISSSHCAAKGVKLANGTPHLCYCHTPMRYVWDEYDSYFGPRRANLAVRALMPIVARRLRRWDVSSASRVHRFVANSQHARARIRDHYAREATVVYPPVNIQRFTPASTREDFYLIVSALTPYKRVDRAIEAFSRLDRRLVIIGQGPEEARLRKIAGRNIEFLGWLPDDEVADWLGRCRAFVLPGREDFGIAAVEAQAAGAPVIALRAGGALETVLEGPNGARGANNSSSLGGGATGVFFRDPTAEALTEAVLRFEEIDFAPADLSENAQRFRPERFARGMREEVAAVMNGGW